MLHLSIEEVEHEGSAMKQSGGVEGLDGDDLLRSMSDDDILFHHIVNDDHELYRLDCCLSELFTGNES